MPVDLHVHTTASDGIFSPTDIVEMAQSIGLEALAITDHDTLEGIEPARSAGLQKGVEIIAGIELGSERHGEEIHILGLLIELDDESFLAKLKMLREDRIKRMEKMVNKLREFNYPINMDNVMAIAGRGSVGRPHLAEALVKAGAVSSISEAFDRYIGAGRPAYVPRYKLDPAEAVDIIRRAGGVPVLAHPGLLKSLVLIEELKDAGLAGLEVSHPAHSAEQVQYYRELAGKHNLVATGGSDFHGPGHKAGAQLGLATVSYSVVDELKKRKTNIK
ncbi:PHP domain-containing protein [Pelotomaculum propionicicum]|uniref:5'-3' exoribonuclease n=1 Tax=Pelotomaculum propionicicum TaxID=258475 RepID=A0A4Y7RUQ6_9FIRM|nr:PHP domain-containing protein [Pelotomaculum propionicicum]NLI12673.1 PHP domain-containing protein [Peptococcaceae bacterium]TEB12611.1 5'-3' exoribonuclease [Pelotomaculum propionicicum]